MSQNKNSADTSYLFKTCMRPLLVYSHGSATYLDLIVDIVLHAATVNYVNEIEITTFDFICDVLNNRSLQAGRIHVRLQNQR